jgi:hypothetical protein
MGAGRGARRRAKSTFHNGGLRRAQLNALSGGPALYTNYQEAFRFRTREGNECWVYVVEESVGWARQAPRRHVVVAEEDDLFWVVGARDADLESHNPDELRSPTDPVPFVHGTYWSTPRNKRLRPRNGTRCLVYAVEERNRGRGVRVPVRYGIRFPGDDSYWVVSAAEVDLPPPRY